MTVSNDSEVSRSLLVEKVTNFTRDKLSDVGQGMWQLLYSSRQRVAEQADRVDPWTLADKVAQKRILERQHTFRMGGGTRASIVDYGLSKARLEL